MAESMVIRADDICWHMVMVAFRSRFGHCLGPCGLVWLVAGQVGHAQAPAFGVEEADGVLSQL